MSTQRPSYILFITDQQRVDYLGCYGHPSLHPHIDAMASEGVRFERFYVAAPVCMPNRASLMTCRMPTSHGVRSLGIPLDMDQVTFVEVMRAAGYDTALIGKSHCRTSAISRPSTSASRFVRASPAARQSSGTRSARTWTRRIPIRAPGLLEERDARSPSPFYGFDHYDCVLRHGTNTGGDYEQWLRRVAPEVLELRGRDHQFPHDYTVPQAVRTKVPEEYYSTTYIANQACEWWRAARIRTGRSS